MHLVETCNKMPMYNHIYHDIKNISSNVASDLSIGDSLSIGVSRAVNMGAGFLSRKAASRYSIISAGDVWPAKCALFSLVILNVATWQILICGRIE